MVQGICLNQGIWKFWVEAKSSRIVVEDGQITVLIITLDQLAGL